MDHKLTIEERLERIESLLLSQKTVFSLEDVAMYTGLSKHYLYKLTSKSEIPFSKPNGKHIYFEKSQIDAWLLRNRNSSIEEMRSKAATISTRNRSTHI